MYAETGLSLYKFRLLFAGLLTIAFLLLVSAIVTAVGSDTILNARVHPPANTTSVDTYDSSNLVTAGASHLVGGAKHALLATGTGLYGACRSITAATTKSGKAIAHGSAAMVSGIWHGTTFIVRGFGSITMATLHTTGRGVMFTLRLPGKAIGTVRSGSGHTVSAILRPADDKTVPVIDAQTSAAVLAHLNAEQQREIAQLQAAQVVANQALDGTIVAGDPNHGGYPAKWDNIRQDSTVDSWGMYNRECVSYAAWKVYQTYGHMPYWGGVGNANEWIRDAKRAGIPTGSTPAVHSVAISMRGYYGHAMWVEAVKGNMIYVSQYNYDLHGHYSEMWVNANRFTYIYFQ
ncbi:MAG TPA: CHAP domain-containing protein [Candidatus Saccharimonadales bacterium]|nr:CHAP domain-containing protein [Candidatus Saccharimonadales bacterium]